MFENFCSDIIQTMKCFALENFNLTCQAEHTKINSRLNFNPGLVLIAFWTTRPRVVAAYRDCKGAGVGEGVDLNHMKAMPYIAIACFI